MTDKCYRNTPHEYETETETETHIIKRCTQCKGRKWKAKRPTAHDMQRNRTHIPVRV